MKNLGASHAEARRLVNRLQAAAPGPLETRRVRAGEAITKLVSSYVSASGHHKFECLKTKADRWEEERAARDAVLRPLETGPQTRTELVTKTRKSRDVVEHLIRRLLNDKEIVQTSFGTYALPQHSTESYVTTDTAIVSTLFARPDYKGDVAQLTVATGKERTAVFSMAKELAKHGVLIQTRARGGPHVFAEFKLAPSTARAIKSGKPIRIGRKLLTLDLPPTAAARQVSA
jgi:hypothetical protein